jgi:hypothetical protein
VTRLLPLLLAGCTAGTPVYLIDAREEADYAEAWERVEEGCAFWGVECVEGTRDSAVIVLLTDHRGHATGGRGPAGITKRDDCQPFVWVGEVESLAVEHELGHAFGLDDRDDGEPNVMSPSLETAWPVTTKRQREQVERRSSMLGECL